MNFEIEKVQDWLLANKLSVHYAKKTQYILFIPPSKSKVNTDCFSITMGGNPIEQTSTYKYLGILIDEKLSWKPQIDKMCSKLSSVCGIISKVRHYLDRHSLMLIYNSLVESRLRYGILSWGTASQQQINRLQVLQNKALRFLSFSPLDTAMLPLYSHFKVLPLSKLMILEQANFMYRFHKNSLPITFKSYCSRPSHGHRTRYAETNFSLPPLQTKISDKSIKVIGPKIWASIDLDIKDLPFRKTFSKHMKKHIFQDMPSPIPPGKKSSIFRDRKETPASLKEIFENDHDSTFLGF